MKQWLHNFLIHSDVSLMTEKEKATRIYLWSLFKENPRQSIVQSQHAMLIVEWAIHLIYNEDCDKKKTGDGKEKPEKMRSTNANRKDPKFRPYLELILETKVNHRNVEEDAKMTVEYILAFLDESVAFQFRQLVVELQFGKFSYKEVKQSAGHEPGSHYFAEITISMVEKIDE